MNSQLFSNSQFLEWLENEYYHYFNSAHQHLKNVMNKHDEDEYWETVEWSAITRMTAQANTELAHHNEKVRKMCGFDGCKYEPKILREIR